MDKELRSRLACKPKPSRVRPQDILYDHEDVQALLDRIAALEANAEATLDTEQEKESKKRRNRRPGTGV